VDDFQGIRCQPNSPVRWYVPHNKVTLRSLKLFRSQTGVATSSHHCVLLR
jgi:hypothetical protein